MNLFTAGTGRFCYQVRALEIGNPSGINASSESNIACAVQEDLVYIPSAIVRGGANPIFKPVISYADVADYELSIINRWGQVFWTSTEPTVGWDGTYGGSPVPMAFTRTTAGTRMVLADSSKSVARSPCYPLRIDQP